MSMDAAVPRFSCWDDAVRQSVLPALEFEAETFWDTGMARKTYWMGVDDKPRCQLERLALAVLRFHCQGMKRKEVQGAEFWVQRRKGPSTAKQGLNLHYDKDEEAVRIWDIWAHPSLATVTYLRAGGAPLVIFSTASEESTCVCEDEESENEEKPQNKRGAKRKAVGSSPRVKKPAPARGWLCFPRGGRHVAFTGNLLHGVPQDLLDASPPEWQGGFPSEEHRTYTRLSLPVNIWTTHQPEGVKRLPARFINKLKSMQEAYDAAVKPISLAGTPLSLGTGEPAMKLRSHLVPLQKGGKSKYHALTEHCPGETGPFPLAALAKAREAAQMSARRGGGVLSLRYTHRQVSTKRKRSSSTSGGKRTRKKPAGARLRTSK